MDIAKELTILARAIHAEDDVELSWPEVKKAMIASKDDLERAIEGACKHRPRFKVVEDSDRGLQFQEDGLGKDIGILGLVISEVSMYASFSKRNSLTNDGTWWGQVKLSWEHHGRGSNGFGVGHVWFNPETGKWIAEKNPGL